MLSKISSWLMAILVAGALLAGSEAAAAGVNDVIVLCYHDVGVSNNNPYTVTKEHLIQHFTQLQQQGFHPISVEQYLQARDGKAQLPEKPILLTFDDGYISFYQEVFPLLKQFHYPAVLALVSAWQNTGAPRDVGALVSWNQVREMDQSGLVTIASHSHDMHRYWQANPSGDYGQVFSTLRYGPNGYETREEYSKRVWADMEQTQHVFLQNLGHQVKTFVWPYGEYTSVSAEAARANGFDLLFSLGENQGGEFASQLSITRLLVYNNPDDKTFANLLAVKKPGPLKVGQLDLDILYDTSAAQIEENIDAAIDLLERSGVNTVFLQAFADDNGSGEIEQVYFHTSVMPVKKDLFSHVAQKLRERGFKVYAWMPTLACQQLLKENPADEVTAYDPKGKGWYRRASPFSPQVREKLKTLFSELAAYSPIDGILFQDDLYLNDYEDSSAAAQRVFKEKFHQEMTPKALADPQISREWAEIKSQVLNNLTQDLMLEVRKYRPQAKVARNIYANVILNPDAKIWMAQDYEDFLQLYDYVVVMAYPFMEKASEPNQWLAKLAQMALTKPAAAKKTVFKLQAYDWVARRWVPYGTLLDQQKVLKEQGAANLAYYPLDIYSAKFERLPF